MERNPIDRRRFLTAAGALAVVEGPRLTAEVRPGVFKPEDPMAGAAGRITQVQLADTGFTCSRQEGGKTVMAGTFIPKQSRVLVELDIASTFLGWGGGYFDFHVGVLPAKPPSPWEPGGKNRIVRANNESRSPLPGVTEYQHFVIGLPSANTIATRVGRTMLLDGLTIGRVYQWELRAGCLSFFKLYNFADGARPTSLAVTADNLYTWAACEGNNRLALLQLGWAELWPLFGYSQEMLCVAEIQLDGKPGGIALHPKSPHLATIDGSNNQLVIVDTEALTVAGSYPLPANAQPSPQRLLWKTDANKIYIGGATDGRLYRFDFARREFDQATVIDPEPKAMIIPLALTSDGRYLWCSSYYDRKIFRVDLHPPTPEPVLVYTTPPGTFAPTCGAVRKSDGSIVFTDPINNLLRHVSGTGTLLHTWSITIPGQGLQHVRSSVQLDPEQVRVFWSNDGVVGWAWLDSAQVINAVHAWFPDIPYGDVALTSNEGTLLALPSSSKVIQWPGGTLYIRPSQNEPTGYGAEHALVTFTDAEVTHE